MFPQAAQCDDGQEHLLQDPVVAVLFSGSAAVAGPLAASTLWQRYPVSWMGTSGNGHLSQLPSSTAGKYLQVLGIKTVALEAAVSELRRVTDCQAAVSGFNSHAYPPTGRMLARKVTPQGSVP